MTDPASFYVGRVMTVAEDRKLWSTLQRARALLVELETSRKSADIDRVRHGLMHEVESIMDQLGWAPESSAETAARIALYDPVTTRAGEPELPFADEPGAYEGWTEEQKRRLYEQVSRPAEPVRKPARFPDGEPWPPQPY